MKQNKMQFLFINKLSLTIMLQELSLDEYSAQEKYKMK